MQLFNLKKQSLQTGFSNLAASMLTASLFFAFFNLWIVIHRFQTIKTPANIILSESLAIFSISLIMFFIISHNKYLFKILSSLIIILTSVCAYFMSSYDIVFDQRIVLSIFATNPGEASELLNPSIIISIVLWAIAPLVFVNIVRIKQNNLLTMHKLKEVAIILILVISPIALNPKIYAKDNLKNLKTAYLPFNYLSAANKYLTDGINNKYNHPKENLFTKHQFTFSGENDQGTIFVLVIGEAARSGNFSLNGYERETNPLLKNIPNLVSFKDSLSCDRVTQYSVPCLMGIANKENFKFPIKETSMISVFNGLGFETSWLDIQEALTNGNMPVFQIANEAHNVVFRDTVSANIASDTKLLDEHLLPYLDNSLAGQGNQFIVLHTYGSHHHYYYRYREEFAQFQPECSHDFKRCSKESIVNSYDNSIIYTDYFLNEVITKLKTRNAILLYVADHAELLGEGGRYLHGGSEDELAQYQIPMLWWASDQFLSNKTNKDKFNNIILNSKSNVQRTHDNVFHSVLDCIGIESDVIDKNLSLCRFKN